MMYLRTTAEYLAYANVGNTPQSCSVGLLCDADFVGSNSIAKSFSGVLIALVEPSTFCSVSVVSKKQDCVATITTESEVVCVARGHRKAMLDLWESGQVLVAFTDTIFKPKSLVAFEDNQSTIVCFKRGVSKQLRRLIRTHRLNLACFQK